MNQPLPFNEYTEYAALVENAQVRLIVEQSGGDLDTLANLSRHNHTASELFFCTVGTLTLDTALGLVTLKPGDIVVIPAGFPHHAVSVTNESERYVLRFDVQHRYIRSSANLWQRLSRMTLSERYHLFPNKPELCRQLTKLLHEAGTLPTGIAPLKLALLLSELADKITVQANTHPEDAAAERMRLATLEHLVDSHFHEDVTLTSAAELLQVSPRQLARIVRSRYGASLHSTLLEKRLETAAKLLTTTDQPCGDIGKAVGFGTSTTFYRAFRTRYGVTPKEYREAQTN